MPVWFFCSQAAPSLRSSPTDNASMRARSDATCRSAPRSAACSSADPFVGQPQRGDGAVVMIVEAHLTRVEFTDPRLHGLELGLRRLHPGRGVLDARP